MRTRALWLPSLVAATLSFALAPSPARAITIAWSNPAGGTWSVTGNWTPPQLPTAADDVVIALDGTYTITLDVDTTVASITFGASSGTQTVAGSNRKLNLLGASTVGSGTSVIVTGGTLGGIGTLTNHGTLELRSTTCAAPFANESLVVVHGTSSFNGGLTTSATSTLRAEGNNTSGPGTMIVANGFTNNGTIELTNGSAGQSATLNVTSGTLVNAPGAAFNALTGAGGGVRTLGSQLDNQGALTVGFPLTLSKSGAAHTNSGTLDLSGGDLTLTQSLGGSLTTTGTITIGAARTMTVSGGLFDYSAGAIGGAGTLSFVSSATFRLGASFSNATTGLLLAGTTVNGPGTLTNATGKTLTVTTSTLGAPVFNQGTFIARGTCALNGVLTTDTTSMLRAEGNGTSGPGTLTVANGFTNNGTIELTNSSIGQSATLNVTSGTLVNALGAVINPLAGSGGGSRTLGAQLDNQGTLNVNVPFTLSRSGAAHTNSGTIDISGADLTLSQTIGASLTTTGTITIGATRTLTVSGGLFDYSAGTIGGAGTLSFTSSATFRLGVSFSNATTGLLIASTTVNGPGTLTNATGRTLTVTSSTFGAPIFNQGTFIARGSCNLNGALTTDNTSMLRAEGNGTSGPGTLTVANAFTNSGTIELTNTSAGQSATLNVTSGTLVNALGAVINPLAGVGGGSRTLGAQLDNQGTLNVNVPLTLSRSGAAHTNSGTIDVSGADLTLSQTIGASLTTTGTITIGATRTMTVSGGLLDYSAGTIGGAGTLSFTSSATFRLGVSFSNAATGLLITSSTVNGPGTLTDATGKTLIATASTFNAPVFNQGTFVARGSCALNGALTTDATSTLRAEGNGTSGPGTLTVANGFTNNGTIELTNSSIGQSASLNVTAGTLVNALGAVINPLAGSGGGSRTLGAQLDNQGTVTVAFPLTLSKSAAAHTNSGTIDVSGADLTLSQTIGASLTTTGTITIGATRTLTVSGGLFDYSAGTIGGAGTLSFVSSATFRLGVSVSNATTQLLLSNSTVNGPGTLTNASGKTLVPSGCTFGAAVFNQGIFVAHGGNTINGTLTTDTTSTLRLEGTSSAGAGALTVANGFTNKGTIELTNSSVGGTASLTVTSGTLVNASGAAINSLPGSGGGSRTLAAQLDNPGTMAVNFPLTINKSGAVHHSSGTVDISGSNLTVSQSGTGASFITTGTVTIGATRTMTVTGGLLDNAAGGILRGAGTLTLNSATFTNEGTVSPGLSPGILTVGGGCTFGATSALEIEIGGPNAGVDYDRLAFSGTVTIAGAMHVSLVNGFSPVVGQSFQILSCGSSSGRFGSITGFDLGNGLSLEPRYSTTGLTLVAVAQTWAHLIPAGTLPPRDSHTAVYAAASNRMVVFGGRSDGGPLNDVWVLTHADGTGGTPVWAVLATSGSPPPARAHHTAVYAPANNTMIVYGGDDATGPAPAMFPDVWLLSNADGTGGIPTWTLLSATGGPPPSRTQHSAVYDPGTHSMIVFGGNSAAGSCGSALNDVWILSNADGTGGDPIWNDATPAGTPPSGRADAVAAYDAANNRMIVVGGDVPCGASNDEVWVLSDANGVGAPAWTPLTVSGSAPSPWLQQAGAYDPVQNRMSLFGGLVSGSASSTLTDLATANGLAGTPAWSDVSPAGPTPDPRSLLSAVQAGGRVILCAGLGAGGRLGDVWVLDGTQGHVNEVPAAPVQAPSFTGFHRPPAPNPTRDAATFSIAVATPQHVDLAVCDVSGRRVATLWNGSLSAGTYAFRWQGRDESGAHVAPGIYFLRMRSSARTETRRIVLVR